jgi:hypothetical protein
MKISPELKDDIECLGEMSCLFATGLIVLTIATGNCNNNSRAAVEYRRGYSASQARKHQEVYLNNIRDANMIDGNKSLLEMYLKRDVGR